MVEFDADGRMVGGYLAMPEGGHGPGVLVLHAWWGLTPFFEDVCDRLASEGFVALAPDRYGGVAAATIQEVEALQRRREDPVRTKADLMAAVDYLRVHEAVTGEELATLGFSAGASWALLLSVLKPDVVGAVVAFYGTEQADYAASRAAYLGHYAEDDDWEPPEEVQATEDTLRAAGREVAFHTYPGVGHWFLEADRPDYYDAQAAGLAWERTVGFLSRRLGLT